jgi:site-specific DNA-cytosine methylase
VSKIRTAACQDFGGAFSMGMTQAGFNLVAKREQEGGFGAANMLANRHLLGYDWAHEEGDFTQWSTVHTDVVHGNPPCSGFSLMSNPAFRGVNSPVNQCMWAFEHFTARSRPLVAIFESVQQAYTQGLPLLRALRAKLEDDTGEQWHLTHLLHNNMSVGGAAIRKRYFWVVSRIPFGVETPVVERLPNVYDVLGDLEGLADTWSPQPYRRPATWWSGHMRATRGVLDGHKSLPLSPGVRRTLELMIEHNPYGEGVDWPQGHIIAWVAQAYYEKYGHLPKTWSQRTTDKLLANGWQMGLNQAKRWSYAQHCRVVTGAALGAIIHPTEPRYVTHREVARIQGFPDDWLIEPNRHNPHMGAWWGKGIPVHVGKWVGGWIKASIEGNPGSITGTPMGERESKIDVGKVWHPLTTER